MGEYGIFAAAVLLGAALVVIWNASRRIRPSRKLDSCYDLADGERYPHTWGFTDTRFEFDGPRTVRVTGNRYPLCGYTLPGFIPFAEEVLGQTFRPEDIVEPVPQQRAGEARRDEALETGLAAALSKPVSTDDDERLIHSHGQLSVDEIYRLLYLGTLDRVVDMVAYPTSEAEVRALVRVANEHGACLIPFGGGTNVSGALTCPVDEERVIISVDMRRMDRIIELDEENLMATVEAGISGKALERGLEARGYTSGHDPDSVELSTLGGWIATNASGMKKNRYGNIEEIVLEASLITPTGEVETHRATPRNSVGIPPRVFLFGSEGNLGIITKAVIKVHPLPAVRRYGSLVFPRMENGVRFLKELRGEGALPASIRLVNNTEFRFGQALKPAPGLLKRIESAVQKFVLLRLLRFKPLEIAACTVVMEGSVAEVSHQQQTISRLLRKHGGISGGASNGRRGYMLTFAIAYIRDFFNQFQLLGETFETSVPWDRIHDVCRGVEQELAAQCERHGIYGKPYLAYRVTQTYPTGVCIYFTMGFSGKGLDDAAAVYHQIEHHLRQVILDHGGSLSHHHGVGKIRHNFLPQVQSPNTANVMLGVKQALDPNNVFAGANGVYARKD